MKLIFLFLSIFLYNTFILVFLISDNVFSGWTCTIKRKTFLDIFCIRFIKRYVYRLFYYKQSLVIYPICFARLSVTKENALISFSIEFSKIILTIVQDKT